MSVPNTDSSLEMVKYDAMCLAISDCDQADEAKDIRDKALAMEIYAKQAMNTDAERKVTEIRIRAERRCGELLAATIDRGGDRRSDSYATSLKEQPKTLSDMGISPEQSSKWQKLAKVPDRQFEKAFASQTIPSTASIIRTISAPVEIVPMSQNVIWLLGRLHEFEKNPVLLLDKSELLNEMTDGMLARVKRITPIIIAYLTDLEKISNTK